MTHHTSISKQLQTITSPEVLGFTRSPCLGCHAVAIGRVALRSGSEAELPCGREAARRSELSRRRASVQRRETCLRCFVFVGGTYILKLGNVCVGMPPFSVQFDFLEVYWGVHGRGDKGFLTRQCRGMRSKRLD